jgi:POT family proton-dependent oligopeptide transporter
MFLGLLIYVCGRRYLPPEPARHAVVDAAPEQVRGNNRRVWMLLLGVGIAATIFRGAYEQIGNTLPLWIDTGVDRTWGASTIPMTWFQSLNPLLVIAMTPLLLLAWRHRAAAGRESSPATRMAIGALIVAIAYALLAVLTAVVGEARVGWGWLVGFFVILTFGELYILPTGLGLFAKLAPPRLGATTVASWFLAIFSGSLLAGVVGMLWSKVGHPAFFLLLAGLAMVAAALLWRLDRPIRALPRPNQ